MYYAYRHIRLDKNEPFYVGIGKLHKNDRDYRRAYSSNPRSRLWHSIAKKAGFEVDIIFESHDRNIIKDKEMEFIKLYGRIDIKTGTLANHTEGGDGSKEMNPVTKEQLRQRMIGNKLMNGRKLTDKHKINIGNSHKGKIYSQETLKRMSNSQLGNKKGMSNKGKKHSEEVRRHLSKAKKNHPSYIKTVICHNTGQIYESINQCAELMFGNTKANKNCIGLVCNGKLKHYKGYIFNFL